MTMSLEMIILSLLGVCHLGIAFMIYEAYEKRTRVLTELVVLRKEVAFEKKHKAQMSFSFENVPPIKKQVLAKP